MHDDHISRRTMLRATTGLIAASLWPRISRAQATRPEVTAPRAISGDTAYEPAWDERLTITAGPGAADIAGATEKTIQAAVDYAARYGGGTVRLLPGTYHLRNAVYLRSHVRLIGAGEETVLIKEPSIETKLAEDSDWYDQEITLADAAGFAVGDGVCLRTKNPDTGATQIAKRTLVARSGNRFKLDRALRENFWKIGETSVSTLFPLITAEEMTDLIIEDLNVDGNRANNAHLDGNYAGCFWFQDCARIQMRRVSAHHGNGDGISWQICHDVVVEDCHLYDNADLGLHPGSGSQRPVMCGNRIERNGIGLFFCWGVKYGLAENNVIRDSGSAGISIGHRDDENVILRNEVRNSGRVGILFRPERGEGFTAKGNRVEENRIIDSGPEDGIGIDIQGVTSMNRITRNEIIETRGPASRIGIRISAEARQNEIADNRIEGYAAALQDLAAPASS